MATCPGYFKVTAKSGLNAREDATTKAKKKGAYTYNTLLYASEEKNGWYYCYKCNDDGTSQGTSALNGWCSGTYLAEHQTNPPKIEEVKEETVKAEAAGETESPKFSNVESNVVGYEIYLGDGTNYHIDNYTIRNVMQIQGLPYQFLTNADARLQEESDSRNYAGASAGNDAALGRKYAEKIIDTMPLLLIQPGTPKFMSEFKSADKKSLLERAIGIIGNNGGEASLDNTLTRDGRYYSFEADWASYYKFVNPICRIAARFLGLQDYTLNGQKLDLVDWSGFINGKTNLFMNTELYGSIPFYINAETSISESFSNDTTQSQLAGTVNGLSDMAREINFLLGYGSNALGADFDAFNQEDLNQNLENVNDIINKLLGKSSMLSNLSKNLVTVAHGGKMIFPEIWSDSSFSRSYQVNFKFTSPDSDKLSIYLNCIVPTIFLLCLCLPRTVNTQPNNYIAPFLVRMIYKGQFNVDMGIITDLSITRGGDDQSWTIDSLPTQIEVSMGVKDLYSALSMTSMDNPFGYDTINNTALMDYMGNMCGINIYKPDILRNIDIWYTQNFWSKIQLQNIGYELWNRCASRYQNTAMSLYNKIFSY